jgi:hypothetical protein
LLNNPGPSGVRRFGASSQHRDRVGAARGATGRLFQQPAKLKMSADLFSNAGLLTSRYECKYFVPVPTLDRIRAYMRPFVQPDRFAALRPGYRYPICSLYLDTPDLLLYRMTMGGNKARFKLRLRRYADGIDQPVFAEIKKRLDQVVIKHRTRLEGESVEGLLKSLAGLGGSSIDTGAVAAGEFKNRAGTLGARPIARIKYMREAYESEIDHAVRITFDTDLVHALSPDGSTAMEDGDWHPTPMEGAIIEIKFTDTYPHWVRSLIDTFQLQKQSIPKYVMSMDRALENGTYQAGGLSMTGRGSGGAAGPNARLRGDDPWIP